MIMAPTQPRTSPSPATGGSTVAAGGRLVAADGRELPLESVHLAAMAGGGIARVVLTQRFQNPFAEPLEVRYLLPLPGDGAVSGFSFVLGDERVVGEVTGKRQARERFERALVQGKTAALLEQERSSLFSQRVGNVPPHGTIVAEVVVDQPLRWLEEGAWEWRFPTVVGPRYQGAPGRVSDAARQNVPVADRPLGVRATLSLALADRLTGSVSSPSHFVESRGQDPVELCFEGDGGVRLDRDVVVRWPVALPDVSAGVLAARPATAAHDGDAFALLTVAPPTGGGQAMPRDLTFLIDTSGSMGGRPLDQARRVVAAMIETLGVQDRIEMIEFGSRPRRWKRRPVPATEAGRREALDWLRKLRARGSTEMHRAVLEALQPLRERSQRQVVLLTDGYIGFEAEIVRTLLERLPPGARLHTVGVGSSVNRSLTEAAARAGRGSELIIGTDEDPGQLVGRLLARTTAPLVTDLSVEGPGLIELAPRALPDLYAESPALIAARVAPDGGELVIRGRTAAGEFHTRLRVPGLELGAGPDGVAALFGREKVADLEMAIGAGGNTAELNRTIEDTGIEFQIASRLTSWVAVSRRRTVHPGAGRRAVEQPHEQPYGMSIEGLGLRRTAAASGRVQAVQGAKLGGVPRSRRSFRKATGSFPIPAPRSAEEESDDLFLDLDGDASLGGEGLAKRASFGPPSGSLSASGAAFPVDSGAELDEVDELILSADDDEETRRIAMISDFSTLSQQVESSVRMPSRLSAEEPERAAAAEPSPSSGRARGKRRAKRADDEIPVQASRGPSRSWRGVVFLLLLLALLALVALWLSGGLS